VGKTSAAATVALAAARYTKRRVLLLSTDPAHSVGDVLGQRVADDERPVPIPGARGALAARELDARGALARERERFRGAVAEMVDALVRGAPVDPSLDRAVLEDLIDLAPPGIDELFAILTVTRLLVSKGGQDGLVVMDTAPTGHALRLLALPEAALEWIHALLRVLLKYRAVTGLGALSESLLGLSHDLRGLGELLRTPGATGFVVVTRPAELPRRETVRLLERLRELRIPVSGLVVNAVTVPARPACGACRRAAAAEQAALEGLDRARRRLTGPEAPMILAPRVAPPPRGPESLSAWGRSWTSREPRKNR